MAMYGDAWLCMGVMDTIWTPTPTPYSKRSYGSHQVMLPSDILPLHVKEKLKSITKSMDNTPPKVVYHPPVKR